MAASDAVVRAYRLDSNTVRYVLTNADGTAYDLTGAKARLRLKLTKTDADGSSELTKTINETPSVTDGAIVLPATLGLADFFLNHDDFPASGALPTDWILEDADPQGLYHLGAKLVTAATKYHTLHDGGLQWILEVMASDFTP